MRILLYFRFSILSVLSRLFFCVFRSIFLWFMVLVQPSTSGSPLCLKFFWAPTVANGPLSAKLPQDQTFSYATLYTLNIIKRYTLNIISTFGPVATESIREHCPPKFFLFPHKLFYSPQRALLYTAPLNSVPLLLVSISLGATISASSQRHR